MLLDEVKYLGVVIDKKLSWKSHIAKTALKANRTRQFLQRNLSSCSMEVKKQCYKTFVRPIMEYACTVWDPVNEKYQQQQLNSIQNKAARWITNDWRKVSSISKILQNLELDDLSKRRQTLRLKMMHNIYYENKFIPYSIKPSRARYKDIRFKAMYGRIEKYIHSFIPWTVKQWNSLPREIVNTEVIENFEKLLINHLKT